MKLSARNQLKGKIVAVTKGQTTAHIRIDIGGGIIVTSSITNEAVDDLGSRRRRRRVCRHQGVGCDGRQIRGRDSPLVLGRTAVVTVRDVVDHPRLYSDRS